METDDQERAMAELEKRAQAAKEVELAQQKNAKQHEDDNSHLQSNVPVGPITLSFAIQPKKKEISQQVLETKTDNQINSENQIDELKTNHNIEETRSLLSSKTTAPTTKAENLHETFYQQPQTKKRKAIEEIMANQESQKEKKNRRDNWICEDIVVKVLSKEFANGKYYKKKGLA
jgi:hypothetical protein